MAIKDRDIFRILEVIPEQKQRCIRLTIKRDLCKTPPFVQFLCQAQILILEILNVCLWLKFSPSLNLNKIEHFSKVSKTLQKAIEEYKKKKE